MTEYEYIGVRRVVYGSGEYEGATFVPVCMKCGRFVKTPNIIHFQNGTIAKGPNAECSKCGPTEMLFEGFI